MQGFACKWEGSDASESSPRLAPELRKRFKILDGFPDRIRAKIATKCVCSTIPKIRVFAGYRSDPGL